MVVISTTARVDSEVMHYLRKIGRKKGETPNEVIRRLLGLSPRRYGRPGPKREK